MFWGRRGLKTFSSHILCPSIAEFLTPPHTHTHIPYSVHIDTLPYQVNPQVDTSLLLEVPRVPPKTWVQMNTSQCSKAVSLKSTLSPWCLKFSSAFLLLGMIILPPSHSPCLLTLPSSLPPPPFLLFLTISWGNKSAIGELKSILSWGPLFRQTLQNYEYNIL